jgi:hypothetical protein
LIVPLDQSIDNLLIFVGLPLEQQPSTMSDSIPTLLTPNPALPTPTPTQSTITETPSTPLPPQVQETEPVSDYQELDLRPVRGGVPELTADELDELGGKDKESVVEEVPVPEAGDASETITAPVPSTKSSEKTEIIPPRPAWSTFLPPKTNTSPYPPTESTLPQLPTLVQPDQQNSSNFSRESGMREPVLPQSHLLPPPPAPGPSSSMRRPSSEMGLSMGREESVIQPIGPGASEMGRAMVDLDGALGTGTSGWTGRGR